jgi:hypothetical protein
MYGAMDSQAGTIATSQNTEHPHPFRDSSSQAFQLDIPTLNSFPQKMRAGTHAGPSHLERNRQD